MRLKKIAAAVLSLTLVCGAVPFSNVYMNDSAVYAEKEYTTGTYGALGYCNYGDYVEITWCDEEATKVEIPSEIDGIPVTVIGYGAFRDHTNLTSVTIPDSVTKIAWHAFIGCTNLTDAVIPDSIEYLGAGAFHGTKFLWTQPDIMYVGEWTGGCNTDLLSAKIKDGTVGIGGYSFGGCKNLQYVEIPDSVTYIGQMAFNKCSSLKIITIPTSVTTLCSWIFSDTALTDVYYEGTEEQWNAITRLASEDEYGDEDEYMEYMDYKLENATIHFGEKAPEIEIIEPEISDNPTTGTLLGDTDNDGVINSSDASNVLAAYAKIATGGESPFTEAQIKAADVNKDGAVDSSDASSILAYYAYTATGGEGTLEEFLA